MIQANKGFDCSIGWFKTKQRESFAQFTHSIYRDGPWVLLTHNKSQPNSSSIEELLENKNLRLLVREQFSYGPYLDNLIEKKKPMILQTNVETRQMFQIIQSHRADITLLPQEEAETLIKNNSAGLRIISLKDLPKGEYRHIMCSKKVPPQIIAKLNSAILELQKRKKEVP